jgi:uroporphyrinogen decarboxylase
VDEEMPNQNLSSRERVLRTINHQEPDRVPFNLALTVDVYHRLRAYLGLPPEPEKAVGVWTNVSASLDLLDAMGVDFYSIGLKPPAGWAPVASTDGLLYDEWGVGRAKIFRPDGSYYFEMVSHPLAQATLEEIRNYPLPDPYDPGRIDGLREHALTVRKEIDKAIFAKLSSSIWEQAWWLRGMQQWMIDLSDNPELVCALLDRVTEVALGMVEVGLDEIGDQVDILRLSGEDLGTQDWPMISPRMFALYVRPRFERLWSCAKRKLLEKNPNGKLMLHSCGNIRPFIPAWIEMGLDILDPIQPRAKGMEPEGLKRDFGSQLVFHGGVDLQHTLPFGTPQEVMEDVRRYIRALAPGGGYIVSPAHNVQSDVPPENLVAIRDAVQEYGSYPIL